MLWLKYINLFLILSGNPGLLVIGLPHHLLPFSSIF